MIILMGIAGSGKGTQGNLLAENHGYNLVSMGDVVRQTATDAQRERMLAGGLLDDQEIIDMIDQVLSGLPDLDKVILDGFPRTIPQAEWLLSQVKAGRFSLETAIHLVASRQAVKERLLGRARVDDKESAIEERFNEYERSTAPILDWLTNNGVAVVNVNAERTVDVIGQELSQYLTKA